MRKKLSNLWFPTALSWLILGPILVALVDGIPAGAAMYGKPWPAVIVFVVCLLGILLLAYVLQRVTKTMIEKIEWRSVVIAFIAFLLNLLLQVAMDHFFPGRPNNQEIINQALKHLSGVNLVVFELSGIVIGPLIEEIVFRGWLVWATSKWYKVLQFILPTILFAWLHEPTRLVDWLTYGGMGALFMAVRFKTGKVQYSVMTHMGWNLFAVLA
ncbi:type II CAAX endopeptidase family protein [Lactobacillaceae bacterium L1_55_11]|nr:type II CAAX endopeptidase family protein [Lactobacillaceae bacterium L1_55_11]